MKKQVLLLFSLLAISTIANSQRLVLLEHFTQASCGPCASQNPALNALLDQNGIKIVAIKYQTSWPGVDPMNAANPTDVQTRVDYYAVNGVPNSVMDGNVYNGSPGGVTQSIINTRNAGSPGVATNVSYVIMSNPAPASDSILITAKVRAINAIPAGHVLHVAAIEREIEFATAPGSNGEKKFESVMKKMFPSASGTTLPALAAGDSLQFTFKWSLKRANGTPVYYNLGQAATVAFVQNNTTKEVLGAGYDEPRPWLSIVRPAGQKSVRIKGGNDVSFGFQIISKAETTQNIKLKASVGTLPAGWAAKIVADGIEYSDSASIPLTANSSKDIVLKVSGDNGSLLNKKMSFKVEANSETINPTVKNALDFTAVTPSNILLLDLAGTATARFNQVFTLLQEPACFLNAVESADLDSAGLNATNVGKLFYTTGAAYSGTLGAYRSESFQKYLMTGGKLLIMGQDIGYDVGQGTDATTSAFYADYMGAEYIDDGSATAVNVTKNADDTLMAPFFPTNQALSGTGSYPDHLAVSGTAANAKAFLDYSDTDFAGIYNYGDNWKLVYLGFRMEAFSTTAAGNTLRNTLFGRINGWFDDNASLSASITSSNTTICQGTPATLTASPATSYLWSNGATTATISVTTAGTYFLQTTEPNGTALSNSFTINVTPSPVVSAQPANQTAVYGTTAIFTTASTTTGVSWQWQKDTGAGFSDLSEGGQYTGTTTATLSVSNVSATDNGNIFRCIVSKDGCSKNSNAAALSTNAPSAVAGIIENLKLAYPNPAKNRLMVPVTGEVKTIILSDLSGKEVLRQSVNNSSDEQILSIENLTAGVYQLRLEAPGMASQVQKIVIK